MSDFKMNVGNVEIVALTDMSFPFPLPLAELWPEVPTEAWDAVPECYPETFSGDRMLIEIGCYLVRSQGHTILIDTGYGPGPIDYIGGLRGLLMADLAANKIDPADVVDVQVRHENCVHVGWNTTDDNGKPVPTFPNARYVAHQADLEHFRRPDVQAAGRYPYIPTWTGLSSRWLTSVCLTSSPRIRI